MSPIHRWSRTKRGAAGNDQEKQRHHTYQAEEKTVQNDDEPSREMKVMFLVVVLRQAYSSKSQPIAVCISGLARSWTLHRVRRSIWAHMVWPILLDADVFFAIDEEHAGRKYDEMIPSSENWSREAQSLFEPVYSARLRASESLAESMLLCRSLVLAREQSRGGDRYEWILRLRPDAVYRRAVPPLSSWPRLRRDASVVWSTYVGGPGCSRSVPKEAEAKGVCLDDNFALMSRPAFEAYFGPWPKTGCRPEKCNECRLGCALHNASVRVGSLPIDFRLMRGPSKLNRTHDQDYELRTPLDQHADKVIAKYDLENRRHPSGDEERDADERRQIVANELVDLLTGHKVKEKHQLRFLVVEPCLGGEDEKNPSIAQFVYGDDESFADETILEADPPMVHGLLAPFAHRGNDWLGCNPPPIE